MVLLLFLFFYISPLQAEMEEDLLSSTGKGNLNNIQKLIKIGIDVNHRDPRTGVTALHIATRIGNYSIVDFLLENKADPNIPDKSFGLTPVLISAYTGNLSILKLLTNKSGNINIQEPKTGYTPLHIAAEKGHSDIIRYLLDKGANTKLKDKKGKLYFEKLSGELKDYYNMINLANSNESIKNGCTEFIIDYNETGIGRNDFGTKTQAKLFEDFYKIYGTKNNFKLCLNLAMNKNPERYYWTGLFLFDKDYTDIQNFKIAEEIFQAGLRSKNDRSSIVSLYYIIGLLYWRENKKKEAKKYFSKAYKLSNKFPGSIPALTGQEKVAIDEYMGNNMR
ncbi:MAG: ankyrin repeat domain-containing protein [Leptospiraceae bacterium]|nr:ankyrin repeat domain-containing protein [Leptospiraceae bacterium]